LVLCINGVTVGSRYSCGNNKTGRKVEFQVARFASIVVLHGFRTDNVEAHRQVDKQMHVADIFDAVLFLFENIFCGKK
jgi:hypothetical protein